MLTLAFPLLAGLGLFMGGMHLMRLGLFALAGKSLQGWLTRFTKTPTRGLITGTIVTMIIQSSSAVAIVTIGLVNANLLSFPQTVGIILGTNIGTTFTTQLIALNPQKWALPMFLIGCSILWFRSPIIRAIGISISGFGCVFLGIQMMQMIAVPLQHTPFFLSMLARPEASYFNGIFIGTIFTALLHSSSAVTAITMGFMNENILSLGMGIAIILGSNIGTCITAVLAAIGGNAAAKQVAWVHVFLNIAGVLLFLPFISQLGTLVSLLTSDPAVQIAHAQTLFNVICSLLALPFAHPIAKAAQFFIKK
ncbi:MULTISPECIES: Na/Pi cotransporter family protein [Aneurinibacillus]|uniref:Na/Pi symporter n=1 Tax=Aneurinibacillus thermoaerophilus TaxID=143495 RepID=A0A1G7Z6F3_ANETH|nr:MULTISPECIES: Na/Pi symporter [Aneurinibacillus]AMA72338.1 Na/Pi-cotransporter [Aneurinibacillus sp. XH2]MED0674809.1 Na/Pi symporter [Aneurinibacillus thermoaerophilus]MED0679759.1 Na/Pi symporter [Aneurinibacillus thermoaerophilus]MED0735791.1 Na/Pi symporter [Aneurinibacillus thermoaerophilus]MED0757999.1 Na/Pi symporter [Aneurinibacillus thermoaerophilus]